MSQLSIVTFHREGVGFPFRYFISAEVIPKAVIGIKCVTVIAFGLRSLIHHILNGLLSAFPDHFPAQIAACLPINECQDVDPVFL